MDKLGLSDSLNLEIKHKHVIDKNAVKYINMKVSLNNNCTCGFHQLKILYQRRILKIHLRMDPNYISPKVTNVL